MAIGFLEVNLRQLEGALDTGAITEWFYEEDFQLFFLPVPFYDKIGQIPQMALGGRFGQV